MAEAMPITPAVVTWARERAGYSMDAAISDFRKIVEWEAGESFPSYPQLERMAEKFKVPVAVFFFPAPPDLPPIEETFRTLGPDQIAEISPRIRLLLRKARTFQMSVEELSGGRNPAKRLIIHDLAFRPTDRIEEIAAEVRAYLGVTMEQQFAWGNVETALEEWRKVLLGVGVYVFKDSFREPGYSGFCLYDDEFPIIYVNNTTAKTRQIFTLFHELAHLLFHTSGIDRTGDGFVDELVGDNQRIEVICNRMAACLLVPEDAFDATFAGQAPTEATATELAQLFSVSREFIFRKFLDRDLITPGEYDQAARRWAEQGHHGTGGDHYNTKIAYLGTEYINLAFRRFYQNRIDYNQLADILDTKPKNLTRLEEYVSRRAP
ncbi:ImmA/IrrE family metallo-endopeptidase [Alphaproteobacteria bacterium HT1-32]|nr:ImmA/IrrE family metallo-endopeptidase [Alphaproteobacteria bacterium HT1-32]